MKRLLAFVSLLGILAALSVILVVPTTAQDNLLQNGDFESETYTRISEDQGAGVSYNVPIGWGGGVVLGGGQPWQNVHPTGFPHTGALKYSGFRSFHMARGGGTFTAFIYQTVNVQPGTTVEGGAWAYIEGNTGFVRVGIDPNGGSDPNSGAVIWSGWSATHYNWQRPSVQATANGAVTLFLYATQEQPGDPNGVYWDAAFLNGIAGQPQPPESPSQPTQPETPQQTEGVPVVEPRVRLNVRTGPGIVFNRIGLISPGSFYRVLGERDGWYQVDYNGQSAYVSGLFVTYFSDGQPTNGGTPVINPEPTVAPSPTGLTYQGTTTINIRRGPGLNFDRFNQIRRGENAAILGRSADGLWVQIDFEGSVGWVAAWLGIINGNIDDLPVVG